MIKYNFDRIFKARGIERAFTYLRNAGFSDGFASKIKNNKVVRLDLKSMERLCVLLRCTPDDFLEWTPNKEDNVDQEHPLKKIRRSDHVIDFTRMLNSVPLGKLGKIEKLIQEEINRSSQE